MIHYIVRQDTLLQLDDEHGASLLRTGYWQYTYVSKSGTTCGFSLRDNIITEAYRLQERDGGHADTIFTRLLLPADQQQHLRDTTRRLYRQLKYPARALKAGIEGTVYVSFVIDTTGSITGLKAASRTGADLEAAALAACRQLTFQPVYYKGRYINMAFKLPLTFRLQR
ncbi:energy transducer TonB [Chitinophaga japonensis]|nr:energy transducer TonB [Chitinophaga japonensis]